MTDNEAIYPFTADENELIDTIIGTDNSKPRTYIAGLRLENAPSSISLNRWWFRAKTTADHIEFVSALTVITALLFALTFSDIGFSQYKIAAYISAAATVAGLIFVCSMNKPCKSQIYGLSADTPIWVIDWKNETVVPAQAKTVDYLCYDFNQTRFCCTINGREYSIWGDSIYFTEEAAQAVLKLVTEVNDSALSEYYPDWRKDAQFKQFYKNRLNSDSPYGFQREAHDEYDTHVIVVPVIINGTKYTPSVSTEKLFKSYLSIVDKQQNTAEQKQQLKGKIKTYQERTATMDWNINDKFKISGIVQLEDYSPRVSTTGRITEIIGNKARAVLKNVDGREDVEVIIKLKDIRPLR